MDSRSPVRLALWIYLACVVLGAVPIVVRNGAGDGPACDLAGIFRPPPADYVAARRLLAWHRIEPDDLQVPAGLTAGRQLGMPAKERLVGRYLKHGVGRGCPIRDADLEPFVDPESTQGCTALAVPIEPDLARRLDVGWTVDLVNEAGCVARGATVLALDDLGRPGPPGYVVLELDSTMLAAFAAADVEKLRVVIRTPLLEHD